MQLYHYTARNRLPLILDTGLSKGDVPLTDVLSHNAVWLTTDLDPSEHGLGTAGPLTAQERLLMYQMTGEMPHPNAKWDNKREVRIKVEIPDSDKSLKYWPEWSKRLPAKWRTAMNNSGGGTRKARTWWIYFGTLESERLEYEFLS